MAPARRSAEAHPQFDRNQLLARLGVVQIRLAEWQNAVQLYRALGGGARVAPGT